MLTAVCGLSLALVSTIATATAPSKVEQAKLAGKTGNRLVGVSSINRPPHSSMKDTEKWLDQAALDKPDFILLTEGCMYNTHPSASREEKDAKSDLLPEGGPITKFLARKAKQHGTKGMMVVGRHGGGWQVFARPKSRKPVVVAQQYGRFPDPEHKENFISCLKSRELPNADIAKGHLTCLMIHYGNISYRTGSEKIAIDPKTEHIIDNTEAQALFKRSYRKPYVIPEQV